MENRAYALVTGLFLIGIAAAIVLWAQWLGGDRHERTAYRVIATQPVSGLNPQAQVRYRGIGVGRVTTIALDPKDRRRILIGVEVDSDIPLTRGTYAQLGMEGITGVAYVHLLDEGADEAPLPKAADGIGEIATRPSFMDTLSDSAEGVARDVRELVAKLNKVMNEENTQRLAKTVASLERVAASLEQTTAELPGAVQRADARMGAWLGDGNRKQFQQSLERLNETTASLPELARETHRLAQDARVLVEQIGGLSGDARTGTLPQVNSLAESVERSAARFGRLSYELSVQPESVLWGRQNGAPGPGEPGFK